MRFHPAVPQRLVVRRRTGAVLVLALTCAGAMAVPDGAGGASSVLLACGANGRDANGRTAEQRFVHEAALAAQQAHSDSLVLALAAAAPDLDRYVLGLALQSQSTAVRRGLVPDASVLTVIDYSKPSVEPRFYVLDLENKKLLYEELVAHGRNSGEMMATRFSNAESSLETSLGLFVTRDTYLGEHGRSLRLEGLEPGFNDRAMERAIVIHGADYVSRAAAARLGMLGRSWGCPALSPTIAPRVIERIRGGSAVFAYYPDARWLATSQFI